MYALATTTVSVLRGTTTDAYGDEQAAPTLHQAHVPAAVRITSRAVSDQAMQTPRVVRDTTAVLPSGTDVTVDDQLRDERTGVVYAIKNVTAAQAFGLTPDLHVELTSTN